MQNAFKISKFISRLFSLFSLALLFSCGNDHRNGSYTIGVDEGWHNVDFMGLQSNVTGFSRDLLKEIGKIEKIKFNLLPVNWDVLTMNLKEGKYEGIFSPLYPYIFNQANYDFSEPYLLTGPVLVVPYDAKWKSIDELKGKEIASLADTHGEFILEKNPGILIRPYDSIPDALNDVLAGTLDGAVLDVIPAINYCRNIYAGKLKIATPPLNDQGLRLLTPVKTNPQMIKAFNDGLEKLKKNGTYHDLMKKWSLG